MESVIIELGGRKFDEGSKENYILKLIIFRAFLALDFVPNLIY